MKRSILILFSVLIVASVNAQQLPWTNLYLFNPALYNPAANGFTQSNNITGLHQQRKIGYGDGWSSGQYLVFQGKPLGANGKHSIGTNLNIEEEFVERRIHLLGSYAIHLLHDSTHALRQTRIIRREKLSLALNAGANVWSQNFDKYFVFDREDDLATKYTMAKFDMGFGMDYYRSDSMNQYRGTVGIFQLPQLLFQSNGNDTMTMFPHAVAHFQYSRRVSNSIWLGPSILFREVFGQGAGLRAGHLDVGAKAAFMKKSGLWLGTGFRTNSFQKDQISPFSTIHFSTGIKLGEWKPHAKRSPKREQELKEENKGLMVINRGKPSRVYLNADFEIPVSGVVAFGPSATIGLKYTFSKTRYEFIDTLPYIGPPWSNAYTLELFTKDKLGKEAYKDLELNPWVEYKGGEVTLVYEFKDDVYQYNIEQRPDLAAFIDFLIYDLVEECTRPVDPKSHEWGYLLSSLESVKFYSLLRPNVSDTGVVQMRVDSVMNYPDFYEEQIILDEKRETIRLDSGSFITDKGLAYLKLDKIRNQFLLGWEDKKMDSKRIRGMKQEKMEILSNNPNLPAPQMNRIYLRFKKIRNPAKQKD